MQNAELILTNTTTEQSNTETTLSNSQHRVLVIQAWIGIVSAIVLYATWLAL